MARLDPIFERLHRERGSELVFASGQPVVMRTPAGDVAVLRQQLTSQQIAGVFAELVPADIRNGFPAAGVTRFGYEAPGGRVAVLFERKEAVVRALVRPQASEGEPAGASAAPEGAAARSAPAPKAASPQPPQPSEPAVTAPASAEPRPLPPAPVDPRAAIDQLLALAVERGASDLHLTSDGPPALRIDGDMVSLEEYGPVARARLREMIFSIAPERNRAQWEAEHDTDFALELPGVRFRVNVFEDRRGIGAAMRQVPAKIRTAEDLALPKAVIELCEHSKGLVLVTGPTGSGKSTTLAAMVDYVNRTRAQHIITIEDPVEFVHPNRRCLVHQREVGVHTVSFKQALRAALREDPDVVLVGEMRDLETISIALETAETGHLVFGTLHTNTAPSTVDRIIDQFPADRQAQVRTMLSESLRGVVSQTLCKRRGGGRTAALEVLVVTPPVANLIREGKTFQILSTMQTGRSFGNQMLNDALIELVKSRQVDPDEAYAKALAKTEFRQQLDRAGFKLGVTEER
ncbi:MAG: type IV pilus twitching motility protein PilT [Myxococcaceae bacterium]